MAMDDSRGSAHGARLVYEDESLVAIHKPSRLHSAPLPRGGGESLCDWVFARWPETAFDAGALRGGEGAGEGGLFHRLDFETSGLVLFARSPGVLASLLAAQEAGQVAKRYSALAAFDPRPQEGARPSLGSPVGMERPEWERLLDHVAAGGPPGLSGKAAAAGEDGAVHIACRFRPFGPKGARVACLGAEETARRRGSPEREYRSSILSLRRLGQGEATAILDAYPAGTQGGGPDQEPAPPLFELSVLIHRGFRHQIRAQLSWLGLPLVGDSLYGGPPAPRLHLMAESLRFPHPGSGALTDIEDIPAP